MFGMTYVSNFKSIRFFSIISFLILISCIIPTEQTKDDLYIKLEKEIMCPVCDGQTLDQSQSLIAEDMKNSIKEKISEGYNEEEIKNYFIDRYGQNVVAYPSTTGFNLLAYFVPIFGLILSILIFTFYIRRQKVG
ncbi:MAG: cytochrome c-type biogenesis protein CcmH [SAR202 cluster bacterium]|jgi:cytochrome c-type biogenesis protein CcmH|nr:MAG: cytochrome c-type biogenesis protein CcmH [SAR202 cluster bacterium]KAA1300021.1 MAG: cytochrome c-type biogenesis protein CcmH [SAR202 cluster bacterium]